jgi:hypothetical protein
MQSGSKAPACLQSAYEFLVKIQKMKLQPTDEVSFFVCSFCNVGDVRPHPDLSILPQYKTAMSQEFAGLDGFTVTFALFDSLRGLIHLAVGFPAHIDGCYITLPELVQICFCAH